MKDSPSDYQIVETTLDDLSPIRCGHPRYSRGLYFKCDRYFGHQGRCKTPTVPAGSWYAWWGSNKGSEPCLLDRFVWYVTEGGTDEIFSDDQEPSSAYQMYRQHQMQEAWLEWRKNLLMSKF